MKEKAWYVSVQDDRVLDESDDIKELKNSIMEHAVSGYVAIYKLVCSGEIATRVKWDEYD